MVSDWVLRKQVLLLKLCGQISLNRRESRKMPLKSTITISQIARIGTKTSPQSLMSIFSALKGQVDLIVGGFPCQDYSVARTKKKEQGIEGKKGVLFWEIIRATKLSNPKYLLLENVDRLLKAPSKQRGGDFAIMLRAFADLGYGVDWRVINPADYGWCQRRKRVFLFVYRKDTDYFRQQ